MASAKAKRSGTVAHQEEMRMPPTVEIRLESSLRELARFKAVLHAQLDDLSVSPRLAFDILLAAHEAVLNAILHGNRQDPRKTVLVESLVQGEWLSVKVRDEGTGFDHEAALVRAARPPDPEQDAGRGLLLMLRLSDEVVFEDGGRTCVVRKRLGRQGP
jgi:serine/threonine-protein kinase RsbW